MTSKNKAVGFSDQHEDFDEPGFSDQHEDVDEPFCSIEVHVVFGAWNSRSIKFCVWPDDKVSRVAEATMAAMCWRDIELCASDGHKPSKRAAVAMDAPLKSLPRAAGRQYVLLHAAEVMVLDDSDSE